MTVTVQYREVYGNALYYPMNETAQELATIAGKKTLSLDTLRRAVRMGMEVKEVYGRDIFTTN